MKRLLLLILCLMSSSISYSEQKVWPKEVQTISYLSKIDQSQQPSLLYLSKNKQRPLLVALHTWSGDYTQKNSLPYYKWCRENDWNFVHPNFRGPNKTSQALGSDYVVSDIESIVEHVIQTHSIDQSRIYLIGVSGGGHAALLMAGKRPDLWAGVSAWCGISNVYQWWVEKSQKGPKRYAEHIESACGAPASDNFQQTCLKRSPITYLKAAQNLPLDINHGVWDGRKGSVPFTHSLYAFNAVVDHPNQLSDDFIKQLYKDPKDPVFKVIHDELYGSRYPLFRQSSGQTRITIFDGKHEIIFEAGLNWLNAQRKGQKAIWEIKHKISFQLEDKKLSSGL